MRILGRVIGFLIILLIIPATAFAFWVYNANQVVLAKETYTPVLQTPSINRDFLVAVVSGFSAEGAAKQNADAVIQKMPVTAWESIAEQVFSASDAKTTLTRIINDLFNWLDFRSSSINLTLRLADIKARLSSPDLESALRGTLIRLPECTAAQGLALASFNTETDSFNAFPVCQPMTATGTDREMAGLARALALVAASLPDQWDLHNELGTIAVENAPMPVPSQVNNARYTEFQLDQVRASMRLMSHLLLVLFLIPIGLLFLSVTFVIRSLKGFLRWVGWVLIVSGIISLLPVFLLPGFNATYVAARARIEQGLGMGGEALSVFGGALVQATVNRLTVVVLFQVAGLIVVGLVCVFISVILPPGDDLTEED